MKSTRSRSVALLFWMLLLLLSGSVSCGSDSARQKENEIEPVEAIPPISEPAEANSALLIPTLAREQAPPIFRARFETTKGTFVLEVHRDWGPLGADRVFNLVKIGYFSDAAFFRAIKDFVVQFGINGNPEINRIWSEQSIADDPLGQSNRRGTVSFATSGPDSRTSQLFINLKDNSDLDGDFVPVARVVEGMDVVDSLNTSYGDLYPIGEGPRTRLLGLRGNEYLRLQFPEMDYIVKAELTE
jgi:peptidyl-prolyl cis-trans isomerase A (cyclophilin A)